MYRLLWIPLLFWLYGAYDVPSPVFAPEPDVVVEEGVVEGYDTLTVPIG